MPTSVPPESLGEATRIALYRALHDAQQAVRRAAHFLHDEYQPEQSSALYAVARQIDAIQAQYAPRQATEQATHAALRRMDTLGRREPAAPAAHTCIYTDDGSDPTPDHPACGAPATVRNPHHDEWYCRRHGDPSWA